MFAEMNDKDKNSFEQEVMRQFDEMIQRRKDAVGGDGNDDADDNNGEE
jgi:hypothetical protein